MYGFLKLAALAIGGAAVVGLIAKRNREFAAKKAAEAERHRIEREGALEKERAFIVSLSPEAQRVHFETVERERLENLRLEEEMRVRIATSRKKSLIANGLGGAIAAFARSKGLHGAALVAQAIASAVVELAEFLASSIASRRAARRPQPIGFNPVVAAAA